MQTEMMLRLLKRDKTSKSGYRIVGYETRFPQIYVINNVEEIRGIEIYHTNNINTVPCHDVGFENVYDYDAFELGIKVGNDWIFGEFVYTGEPGIYEFIESKIKE